MNATLRLIGAGLAMAMATAATLAIGQEAAPTSRMQMQLSFAPLVKATAPAVVNVYVTQRVKEFVSPFGDDPFFRDFFSNLGGQMTERMQNSLGSGVIVREDGLVVTNNHVVQSSGQADIRVALSDKREFPARVLERDEKLDLAVLKIETRGEKFPRLEFADSDQAQVGDLVLAIGDPFGVGQTVTSGIISALARSNIDSAGEQSFIQTDAAINPGNSGGALIDMNGRVVGINSAIVSRSGGSHGVGFAIPSNLVKVFLDSALSGKQVVKPWFGARLEPVTREAAQALSLERVAGAVVVDLDPEGPASKAGVELKDVIVEADGKAVDDPQALQYRLETKGVGAVAKLKLLRGGQPVAIDLPLVEAPKPEIVALAGAHPFDGAEVSTVTPGLALNLNLGQDAEGVAIVNLQAGSIAQGLGFKPGDVISRVNRGRIRTVGDLQKAIQTPQRLWRLEIKRGGAVIQLDVNG